MFFDISVMDRNAADQLMKEHAGEDIASASDETTDGYSSSSSSSTFSQNPPTSPDSYADALETQTDILRAAAACAHSTDVVEVDLTGDEE